METLYFVLVVLIVAGLVCAIAYQIPFPPPLAWLRWVIPVVALLVAVMAILQRTFALP